MPLPLPNLDDRRWGDLVDEARALLPRLAPAWTDYNVSDPGITLLDLLAWIAEADVFGIDRVPREHREAFLALAGVQLRPVRAACTPLQFTAPMSVSLPKGIVFATTTPSASHQLQDDVEVLGCALTSVQVWTGTSYVDRTQDWRHGAMFDALGPDPSAAAGAALLLGFDPSHLVGPAARLSLWLGLDDAATAGVDEMRLDARHHSAATAWEYYDGTAWQPFADADVVDETRALTRSGRVVLPLGEVTASAALGLAAAPQRWVRVRVVLGRHDVAPRVGSLLADASPVVQASLGCATWNLTDPHDPLPAFLTVGATVSFRMRAGPAGRVIGFDGAASADDPTALVVSLPTASSATVGLSLLPGGVADGAPSFASTVAGAPFTGNGSAVWTADETGTQRWRIIDTLRRSTPGAYDVAFDAQSGTLLFGDGEHGRVPAAGSAVIVRTERTNGVAGTPTMRSTWTLDTTDPHTAALTQAAPIDPGTLIVRAGPTRAAVAADDLQAGEGRAADQVWTHERLIEIAPHAETLDQLDRAVVLGRSRPPRATTALDFERMALEVPGTAVARARAWAGLDARQPELAAPGTVTVVVVPGLPAKRPSPTPALLTEVRRFLCPRRTLGTRLVVTGPDYVEISVTATVRALPHVDPARVQADAAGRLDAFLHPLTGGPAGRGWPFGRDVFQAEILRELDLVDGLDHVEQLELTAQAHDAGCGNVCIGVLQLVVSGTHQVTVL